MQHVPFRSTALTSTSVLDALTDPKQQAPLMSRPLIPAGQILRSKPLFSFVRQHRLSPDLVVYRAHWLVFLSQQPLQLVEHAVVVVEVLVEVVVVVLVVVVVVVEMIRLGIVETVVGGFGVVVTGPEWPRNITAQTVKKANMIVIMEITPTMHPISRDFLLQGRKGNGVK